MPDAYVEQLGRHEVEPEAGEFDELSELLAEELDSFEPESEPERLDEDESVYEVDEAFDTVGATAGRGRLSAAELAAAEFESPETLAGVEEGEDEGFFESAVATRDAEAVLEELDARIHEYLGRPAANGRSVAVAEEEKPPAVPGPGGGAAPPGKWVVLVAGFDYEQKGVDFEQIALNRMRLLIRRNVAAQKKAKTPLAQVIETAPRFVLFDFKSGLVRRSVAAKPSGTRTWVEIAKFDPVTTANYTVFPSGRHVFDKDQAGRMSITDVYDHVREIGRTEPGSLGELSFLSHGWIGGPILVNSDDTLGSGTDQRDPNDKDTRVEKDFIAPTMDATALAEFRAAFATDGFIWAWGCVFASSPRQVLHRLLSSTKYRATKLGDLVDTDKFKFDFPRDQADKFFDVDPVFFPTRGADGNFPLTFERTFSQIKDFFRGRISETYCQNAAVAAQVACFGGLPGTYSDYEKRVELPVMVVPTKKPPYSDDFTRSIRFYTTYLGMPLDPERRNYGRYDP